MERNTWNNQPDYPNDRERREHNRNSGSQPDKDRYRGAYRFDTDSDHRNQSTWNGFEDRDNRDRRGYTDYNQNFNRNYNNDYNRNYNDSQQQSSYYQGHPRDGRYENSQNANTGNRSGYGNQRHESVHDRIEDRDPYGTGNFSSDYRPDTYGYGGGSNYGNMAGSLSYGYDGSNNADPDWNSRYEPLSGQRRSYHGNYETRHPDQDRNRDRDNSTNSNDWY